jgi:hypothetical protein
MHRRGLVRGWWGATHLAVACKTAAVLLWSEGPAAALPDDAKAKLNASSACASPLAAQPPRKRQRQRERWVEMG